MSVFPSLADHTVHVCWVDATRMTETLAEAGLAITSPEERIRYHRFRRPIDAHQFLLGRLLIRHWLASETGVPADTWRFSEGERGRPDIAGAAPGWSFNLAHSGGVVACALARGLDAVGSDIGIGVDLEDLERRPMAPEIASRFCAPEEVADIERQAEPMRMQRFLTYWTLKECYLKARGLGIAVHLGDIAFRLDGQHPVVTFRESLVGTSTDWAFALFQPTPRYLLSVAAPQPHGTPRPAIVVHGLALADVAG